MYCSRVAKTSTTKHAASQLLRSYSNPSALRLCLTTQQPHIDRNFSTSLSHFNPKEPKDHLPSPKDVPGILILEPAWSHPVYTEKQMRENIRVAHRKAKNWSDYIALGLVRFLRWGTDIATGFKHNVPNPNLHPGDKNSVSGTMVGKETKYTMSEKKWLIRFIFLESVAGVPGMVAGMLRHLQSIRRLRRDNGWIETLLEEAYNERMHLLTFLKLQEPGWFMKMMILGAQGVFFNTLFLSYLVSPRTCHRFVGYLEEEAVHTYSLAIQDIEAGLLPEWSNLEAPEMAVRYWDMPEGQRTMRDLLLYIRADEAKHREVNHTLGNLEQNTDPNPFISKYVDPTKPHPGKGIRHLKPTGWEREEVVKD